MKECWRPSCKRYGDTQLCQMQYIWVVCRYVWIFEEYVSCKTLLHAPFQGCTGQVYAPQYTLLAKSFYCTFRQEKFTWQITRMWPQSRETPIQKHPTSLLSLTALACFTQLLQGIFFPLRYSWVQIKRHRFSPRLMLNTTGFLQKCFSGRLRAAFMRY